MKKTLLSITTTLAGLTSLFAQNPSTTIATWKNDAKGTYNIIHDDFGDGGVIGIQNYADTMQYNRGLKFTFGAITSSCEADPNMYAKAKSMIDNHGHEIINHSHTHSCALNSPSCGGTGTNFEWGEPGTSNAFDIEIDYSGNSIKNGTGYTPRFFIYPYDQYTDAANSYLQSKGYLGSRTGAYNAAEDFNFAPDEKGFFQSALVVDVQTVGNNTNAINLNYWVDQAIENNQWVNRELHNVGNTGWGSVTVANYRTHLNYVKSKVVSGDLWVGTISEILTYQIQKLNYASPSTVYSAVNKEINITWPTPGFDVATYLSPMQIKTPVTVKVNLDGLTATDYIITQAGKTITTKTIKNGTIYFDAYPHEGSIKIELVQCPSLCIVSPPVNETVVEGNVATLTVGASGAVSITYQWMKNGNNILNATSSTLSLSNVQLADSGMYSVKVTAGQVSETSAAVKLKVTQKPPALNTPYANIPMKIPGKIEAEFFDNGGQGIAYNDLSNSNEGDASTFRIGTTVDIENCIDGGTGYDVGYSEAGEWLKYTVDVATSQNYNIEIRYATLNTTPALKFYMNDVALTENVTLSNSGGWTKYKSYTFNDVPLVAGNNQVLKVEILTASPNLNYFNFTPSIVLGLEEEKSASTLTVFPNPSQDAFTINGIAAGKVQIIALNGDIVNEIITKENQSSLKIEDNLEQGVYIIKFIGKNVAVSTRFVKL